MASFLTKLARLPAMPSATSAADVSRSPSPEGATGPQTAPHPVVPPVDSPPPPSSPPKVASTSNKPSLEELRDRIARIVARGAPPAPRADPTGGELPFRRELSEQGPLYVHRVRSVPAARVGRAPLIAARDADPAMLALLSLDPSLAIRDPKRALYLDTETTGLAGGTGTVPFLVGLSWFDEQESCFVLEQLLLRRLGEEAPILAVLSERVRAASMIVTYNGKSFDVPLLRTRYVMNRLPEPSWPPHLDLVHMARRIHGSRLRARSLTAVESEVLGSERVGDVAGGDIVATYAHFLRTGDEEALAAVVEHNAKDVLSMVALIGLYGEPLRAPEEGRPAYSELHSGDLARMAHTMRRASARLEEAERGRVLSAAEGLAEESVVRGGGASARRIRGDIAKARGDKARALLDYQAIEREVDDPALRLALAKLYEHHVRAYEDALEVVLRGTGEGESAEGRRKDRLRRKLCKKP